MPMIKPLVDCVTMQESDVTQLAKAGKSKHHLDPICRCRRAERLLSQPSPPQRERDAYDV
jgi:hypothetical protein